MKKAIQITLFFSFIIQSSFGQSNKNYNQLAKEAWNYYQIKNYKSSASKYLQAFEMAKNNESKNDIIITHRFNAACALALSNEKDKAFQQLFIIVKNEYSDYKMLISDTDLKSLHKDPRWNKLIKMVKNIYERLRPLTKQELKKVFQKYRMAHDLVFRKGATIKDADNLYAFYTNDFKYNHPKYGGVYNRELLYNNTVTYLKKGAYDDYPKTEIVNIIIGLNAIVIEQKEKNETETTMTLYKFRKDKIYYIEEYW